MATTKQELIIGIVAQDRVTAPIKRIQSSIIRFVGAVSASLAAVRVIAFPIQQALEFDRAMRDVQKTTGFTDNQINKLGVDLNKLGTELAVSQQELAAIAAVGGQLGLGSKGVEAIRQFTESVARAQVTLGLTAEATAEVGAQLLNIFNIDVGRIENLFSLINELTNNSVANAADLADIMKRVGNIAELSAQQVGALAAFARDLGITAEVAGTSYAKFFTNLSTKAEDFAGVVGKSTEEWVQILEEDAVAALLLAADAINKLDGTAKASTIKELFGGGRLFAFGSKIVDSANTGFARFYELLGLANVAYAEGTSSIREYENILKSVSEQFKVVGNAVRGLAIEVGSTLLPDLKKLSDALKEFLTGEVGRDLFLELGKGLKVAAVAFEDFVTSLVESNVEWGKLLDNIVLVLKVLAVFLGLQLAQHFAAVALRTYAWLVGLRNIGSKVAQITAEYLQLHRAQKAANLATAAGQAARQAGIQSSVVGITALAAQYRELSAAVIARTKAESAATASDVAGWENRRKSAAKYEAQLKLFSLDALRRQNNLKTVESGKIRGLSAATEPFTKLDLDQQRVALRLQAQQTAAINERLAATKVLQAQQKAAHEAFLKRSNVELAGVKKGTSTYNAAIASRTAATNAFKVANKSLNDSIRNDEIRLGILTKVVETNTLAFRKAHFEKLRGAGVNVRYAASLAGIAVGLSRLEKAVAFFGRTATRVATGLKGLYNALGRWPFILLEIASLVYIFWDDITSAFGGGTEELSEEAQRKIRAEGRKVTEAAKNALAEFESAVNRPGFREEIDPTTGKQVELERFRPLEELNTGGLEAYNSAVLGLTKNIVSLASSIQGADVKLALLQGRVVAMKVNTQNATTQMAKLTREQLRLENAIAEGKGTGADTTVEEDRLAAVIEAQKSLTVELAKYKEALIDVAALEKATGEARAKLAAEREEDLANAANSGALTKELFKTLQLEKQLRDVVTERGKNEARILELAEKANLKRGGGRSGAARASTADADLVARQAETRRLAAEVESLKDKELELVKAREASKGDLTVGTLTDFAAIAASSEEIFENTYGAVKALSDAGALKSQEEFDKRNRDIVVTLIAQRAAANAVLEKFKEYRKPIDRVLDQIDGMFDNIGKTTRRTKKDLEELGYSLDDIIAKRVRERELVAGDTAIDKKQAEREKSINKKYDNLIKREVAFAQSSGRAVSQTYLNKLEERRKKELEAAAATSEGAKATLRAEAGRKQATKAIDELTKKYAELRAIQTKLDKLSKDPKQLETEKGREDLQELVTRYQELQGEIDRSTDAAKGFVQTLSDVTETTPRYPGDTKGKLVVSDEELADFNAKIDQVSKGYDRVQDSIVRAANAAKKITLQGLENQETPLSGLVTQLSEKLGTFTENLNNAGKKAIDALSNQAKSAFSNLPDAYADAVQKIESINLGGIGSSLAETITKTFADGQIESSMTTLFGRSISGAFSLVSSQITGNPDLGIAGLSFTVPKKAIDDLIARTQAELLNKRVTLEGVVDFNAEEVQETLNKGNNGRPYSVPVTLDIQNTNPAIRAALNLPAQAAGGPAGGPIWGRGTSTSDSILARLSRGEFVIKAAAVRKYGMNVLHRINNMILPRGALPAFAMGGVVGDVVSSSLASSVDGITERVQVDVNMGGERSTLFGERQQVRNFVATMKRLEKGA